MGVTIFFKIIRYTVVHFFFLYVFKIKKVYKYNFFNSNLILNKKENFKYDMKHYKSNNFIISNSKLYMSEAALNKNLSINNFNENVQEIIDTELFWKYADKCAFLID